MLAVVIILADILLLGHYLPIRTRVPALAVHELPVVDVYIARQLPGVVCTYLLSRRPVGDVVVLVVLVSNPDSRCWACY